MTTIRPLSPDLQPNMAKNLQSDDDTIKDEELIGLVGKSLDNLDFLRSTRKNVRIKCGAKNFHVHRSILCQSSPKFQQISEAIDPSRVWQINMNNVPPQMMRPILQYVYKRSNAVFLTLHLDALFPLLTLAHSMEMEEAETGIFCAILKKTVSCSIIAYIWDLACDYNNFQALKEIVEFIHENMAKMIAEGFFRAIRWDQLHLLMAHCFCLEDRPVVNLCNAVVQWLKVDPEQRRAYTQSIARSLKWKRLSKHEISDLTSKEPLFCRILKNAMRNGIWFPPANVRENLNMMNAQKYTIHSFDPQRRKIISNIPSTFPRREKDVVSSYLMAWRRNIPVPLLSPRIARFERNGCALIALTITRNNFMAFQFYFPDVNEWTIPHQTVMLYYSEARCFALNEMLYVVGGRTANGSVTEQCYIFNVSKLRLSKFADLRHPRAEHGLASFGKYMYLIGGVNCMNCALSAVVRIPVDAQYQAWRHLKPLRCKCSSPGIAVDPEGFIFVIGGSSCNCECYDVKKDVSMEMVSLPEEFKKQGGMKAIYLEGQVYAFREYCPMEVCIFNPSRNELCVMRTLGTPPRDCTNLVMIGREFWALDKDGIFYLFKPEYNIWRKSSVKRKYAAKIVHVDVVKEEYLGLARRLLVASY